jgi:peptide/nickel transport system permease protein
MNRFLPILFTIGRGLAQAVGIVVLIFVLCRVVPGDVVDVLGLEGGLTNEQAAAMRHELGLDQSLAVQFLDWVTRALHGDFGMSLRFNTPVSDMLCMLCPSPPSLPA